MKPPSNLVELVWGDEPPHSLTLSHVITTGKTCAFHYLT
jgi:hypothetical protein